MPCGKSASDGVASRFFASLVFVSAEGAGVSSLIAIFCSDNGMDYSENKMISRPQSYNFIQSNRYFLQSHHCGHFSVTLDPASSPSLRLKDSGHKELHMKKCFARMFAVMLLATSMSVFAHAQDAMKQDEMKKDDARKHDNMKKDDAMKKDDGMKKDDAMAQDDSKGKKHKKHKDKKGSKKESGDSMKSDDAMKK
jgi:hypothetical protein